MQILLLFGFPCQVLFCSVSFHEYSCYVTYLLVSPNQTTSPNRLHLSIWGLETRTDTQLLNKKEHSSQQEETLPFQQQDQFMDQPFSFPPWDLGQTGLNHKVWNFPLSPIKDICSDLLVSTASSTCSLFLNNHELVYVLRLLRLLWKRRIACRATIAQRHTFNLGQEGNITQQFLSAPCNNGTVEQGW